MPATDTPIHVTRHVRLTTPAGDELATDTLWFEWIAPPSIRVLVDWDDWRQLRSETLLGIEQLSVPADLVDGEPVVLTATLEDGVEFPADRPSLRRRLADPANPLRSTASWRATAVKQAQPPVDELVGRSMQSAESIQSAGESTQSTSSVDPANPADSDDPADPDDPVDPDAETPPNTVELAFQQHRPPAQGGVDEPPKTPETDDAAADQPVPPVLKQVADGLRAEGWSYQVETDAPRLSLEATAADHQWPVFITALDEERCLLTSVLPDAVDSLDAEQLLAYNGELHRGGFALVDGERQFRTPFSPGSEPVADALGENVTAVVEQLELAR